MEPLSVPMRHGRIPSSETESADRVPGKETAIGDAVGLAINAARRPEDKRVCLIPVTDG